MAKITVKLILDTHLPGERDITDAQLANLQAIALSNKSIRHIDNLEAFYNIEKLYLDHNSIEEIDNIDFMPQLRILDLSFNLIGAEQLVANKLPSRLETLILVGNPCCEHPEAIQALKDSRPNLDIITEGEDTSPTTREEDDIVALDEDAPSTSNNRLDVDELLREIVERKCKIESLQAMDIPHIIHELDHDTEEATTQRQLRFAAREARYHNTNEGQVSPVRKKLDVMMQEHREEDREARRFIEVMRERARKQLAEVKYNHEGIDNPMKT